MNAASTEAVIRNHLKVFLEQHNAVAMLDDYADDARLHSDLRVYQGKREIQAFFEDFFTGLPPRAIERFALRTLRVDGRLGYITWNVGDDIPLGTDTFVVDGGKIVSQTVAMHVAKR